MSPSKVLTPIKDSLRLYYTIFEKYIQLTSERTLICPKPDGVVCPEIDGYNVHMSQKKERKTPLDYNDTAPTVSSQGRSPTP
jgi:hypothetical protein